MNELAHQDLDTIQRVLGAEDLSQVEKLTMIAYTIHPHHTREQIAHLVGIDLGELAHVKRNLRLKDWLASPEG